MYEEFYGLKENPFNLTPDPQFLFLSKRHADAFKYLIYGIKVRKGFILVTGDVGSGKTIICRALLGKLGKEVDTALILNPQISEKELMAAIIEDLGMEREGDNENELLGQLRSYLLKKLSQGGNVAIIIDEAQDLSFEVLEKIRLLSNLETEKEKLLQIILVGQSELEENLKKPEMRQVNQRIAVRYRLGPLRREEVKEYIRHRLRIAGAGGDLSFSRGALRSIFKYTRGIPRVINLVCDRVLLAGYYAGTKNITSPLVLTAISDLRGDYSRFPGTRLTWGLSSLLFILVMGGLFMWYQGGTPVWTKNSILSPLTKVMTGKETCPGEEELKTGKETCLGEEELNKKEENFLPVSAGMDDVDLGVTGDASDYKLIAFNKLLNLWGIDDQFFVKKGLLPDVGEDHFWLGPEAKKHGFEVNYFNTNLGALKGWDIPCILSGIKSGAGDREIWVVLQKVSDVRATIFHPTSGETEISREELSKRWGNEAIIFWKNLDSSDFILQPGMEGEGVERFAEKLKALGYFKGIPPRSTYDREMRQVVVHYQREHGLVVDGIIGPRTKMVIYRMLDPHYAPSLSSE